MDSERKIQKLLRIVKQDKLVLMEGQLTPKEESELIEETMEMIDSKFKGIEVASLNPMVNPQDKLKKFFSDLVYGKRRGLTVIGPANIVKEIRKDPNRVQLFLSSRRK